MISSQLRIGNRLAIQDSMGTVLETFVCREILSDSVNSWDNKEGEQPTPFEYVVHNHVLDAVTAGLCVVTGIQLTPEIMSEYGFKFRPCGISGADMWQGMAFWIKDDFLLRGNLSRSRAGVLHLEGFFNCQIKYVHELQNLYFAITAKELL
jgi:hypothetical protein